MQPLDKTLRNQLDRTIRKARPVAEQAAEAALEQLGVGEESPPSYLGEDQRGLRRRLRAHARSLGDPLKDGAQAVVHLIGEIAYEHWHRMLFARFLAENDLLMYDGVAVTLEECEELAEEEGQPSGWALAARLASTMLPQVFRVDSPVFELTLAAEYQRDLEGLLIDLPVEVFQASDSLGWVYQFWQTDNKERINRSEVKIGADELPAVTQLFTEPYMVSFLLDNSLGAWWAARRLSEDDLASAESEQELRDKASLPGVPLEYLRFVKDEETGHWTPAAGTFDTWPQSLAELKTLDPCCGSGHFLVAALLMLVPMRMEGEGLSACDAVDAVLRDNLHGLEIDQRCVELAAFALALTAWRFPSAGGYRSLPELHLACSGLSINTSKTSWIALAKGQANVEMALEKLHAQFKSAPTLGSLISPKKAVGKGTLFSSSWDDVYPILEGAVKEKGDHEYTEMAITALGLSKAANLLYEEYNLVVTNVPFKNSGAMSSTWKSYVDQNFPNTNKELSSAFIERTTQLVSEGGVAALVFPQGLFYKDYHSKFRSWLLTKTSLEMTCFLGSGAFEEISGEEVSTSLSIISKEYKRDNSTYIIDSSREDITSKKSALRGASLERATQSDFLNKKTKNLISMPNKAEGLQLLSHIASHNLGICTGDGERFYRFYWECPRGSKWKYIQGTTKATHHFSGLHSLVSLGGSDNGLIDYVAEKIGEERVASWIRGRSAWGNKGVLISATGDLKASLYMGGYFDENTVALCSNPEHYKTLWSLAKTEDYNNKIRSFDNSLKVRGSLTKCKINIENWGKKAQHDYPRGLPEPYSDDPTQWIFHGHPCGSVVWDEESKWTAHGALRTDDTVLQVAVARLLDYCWPAELDSEMELAEEQREWVQCCEALLGHADRDGIVCLPAVGRERRAVDRLEALLADAYGDQWSATTRGKLLESVDHAGKDLESWLRDKFFAQHCKLFQNRPFIWHIWDGLKDGFSALVNYHQLDYKTLETLTYTYLGDWITQQKKQIGEGIDGAEARLAAAEALQKSLELILEGEEPYDIFVRWKPLEEQPIGWNPDLNDGVRLNIRPFMSVPDVKKRGAGVLVHKPNIHWKKDRGKDVESAPWYNLGPNVGGAKGDRINDYHLTLAAKRKAQKTEQERD